MAATDTTPVIVEKEKTKTYDNLREELRGLTTKSSNMISMVRPAAILKLEDYLLAQITGSLRNFAKTNPNPEIGFDIFEQILKHEQTQSSFEQICKRMNPNYATVAKITKEESVQLIALVVERLIEKEKLDVVTVPGNPSGIIIRWG